jgi:hypothetical protein
VFRQQGVAVPVVVSDNSTKEDEAVEALRLEYGFRYVRQSGALTIPQHFNACFGLVSTPWILLLHDDDELYPDALEGLLGRLGQCGNPGIVVGGVQQVNPDGSTRGEWRPASTGCFYGEEGVLRLGLDYSTIAPSSIMNVEACRRLGGYRDIGGKPADYTFALHLAYAQGIALCPELIGRYRFGHSQVTDLSTPAAAESWLDFTNAMAAMVTDFGVSRELADRLVDYFTWSLFLILVPQWWNVNRGFVHHLCGKCLEASPKVGEWQARARREYPFLFWWPRSGAWTRFRILRKVRRTLGLEAGGWCAVDFAAPAERRAPRATAPRL